MPTGEKKVREKGALLLVPPAALSGNYLNAFKPYRTAMASGWMALRGSRRRRGVDKGFVLSDHADWDGLNQAIEASGAETVLVTHGYTEIYSQYLREKGYDARPVKTEYTGEGEDNNDADKKEGA